MSTALVLVIFLILIVAVLCLLPFLIPHEIENTNLGNILLDYTISRCSNDNLVTYRSQNSEVNDFLKMLPSDISFPDKCKKDPNYLKTVVNFYSTEGIYLDTNMWHFHENSKQKIEYWKKAAPILRDCIHKYVRSQNKTQDDVVIHMRCSDVPFQEKLKTTSIYHIQNMEYYDWAFQKLNITPNEKITILGTHKWRGNKQNEKTCSMWTYGLKERLEQKGYVVEIQQGSVVEDFITLFNSKKSIGSCSSFSFTSMIGKEHFVMPLLGSEELRTGKYIYPDVIPDWMYPRPGILHHTVKNYHTYTNEHLAKSFINQ